MSKTDFHVLVMPSWYATYGDPINGIFVKEQAQALQDYGLKVGVVYPETRSLRYFRPGMLKQVHFQITTDVEDRLLTYRWTGWNFLPQLPLRFALYTSMAVHLAMRYVQKWGKPQIIHAHAALWGGYSAVDVSQKLGIPFVVTEHDHRFAENVATPLQREQAYRAYSAAKRVISVSSATGNALVDQGLVAREKLRVIPNMIDIDTFTLPPIARPQDRFTFVEVAYLREAKRIDVLLKAFAQCFACDQSVTLEIAGDGDARLSLEALARDLNIAAQVTFHGQKSREEVLKILWRSHAFVHPSQYETFGVAIVEALATGMPVVVTDCGGPRDIMRPELGFIVPIGDVDAFADAMRAVRNATYDPQMLRQSVIERFSEEAVCQQITNLYDEVLSAKKA